jgi:hypothetical protein
MKKGQMSVPLNIDDPRPFLFGRYSLDSVPYAFNSASGHIYLRTYIRPNFWVPQPDHH